MSVLNLWFGTDFCYARKTEAERNRDARLQENVSYREEIIHEYRKYLS